MAAMLAVGLVEAAPGNMVTLTGAGLVPGSNASVVIGNQGVTALPNIVPTSMTLPSSFATDGSSVSFTIPDALKSGPLTVTAGDGTVATCSMRIVSQYVQASEYLGEGTDLATLVPGELDVILRRASAYADAFMGGDVRILQRVEEHKYHSIPDKPPRIYPYHTKGRKCPIASVDQLTFISASDLITVFQTTDLYVNPSLNYIEILAYAIGNYALLGELEVIGYSANVMQLAYTAGFAMLDYPSDLRNAVVIIATALLTRRNVQQIGAAGFVSTIAGLTVDTTPFQIPSPARVMLQPYVALAMG